MAQTPLRKSVAALARTLETPILRPLDAVVEELRPHEPVHAIRPQTLARTAAHFVAGFPGETLYAVKCNADPRVLRALWDGGVRGFDCASPAEIALVRSMFGRAAAIAYMHPVRARPAIREAYGRHAVRRFVIDSHAEFHKLREETAAKPGTLDLIVRIAPPAGKALHDLSGKFGAADEDAVALLRLVRPYARKLGISFHVGSQNGEPAAFARAIAHAEKLAVQAGVGVEILDVGGGFPVAYPGQDVPPIDAFFDAIKQAHGECRALASCELWAEPGRALVAAGGSVVVQVQARRGQTLYINDGVYGALADAGVPGLRYPTRMLRKTDASAAAFDFYGPTCDSADFMKGPFMLPADVREGDWIELGQLGAYGAVLRTGFNGFERAHLVEVEG
jgi:ornithine decarboxylase